jgi:hypothetical protein
VEIDGEQAQGAENRLLQWCQAGSSAEEALNEER